MKNLISNIVIFIIAISILALILGSVGADDLEGVQEYENYSCKMINSGAWGAGEARKTECKNKVVK